VSSLPVHVDEHRLGCDRARCDDPSNAPTRGSRTFGQLRRNTDRFIHQRLAELALAITVIVTIKLIKWADRWSPTA
jgi:hypothetical protein